MKFRKLIALCALSCLVLGCEKNPSDKPNGVTKKLASNKTKTVVATTTMIADMATQLGAGTITVKSIMKPGGDPHLHQPTPGDAKMVAKSDLVLTNGLYLEGWIDDLVKNAGGKRDVIVVTKDVKPITMKGSPGGVDPHFWFDVKAWSQAADTTSKALIALVGTDEKAIEKIKANTKKYKITLAQLDTWVKTQLSTVPESQRILITSHDAFNYMGRAYGLKVVGIQGTSTEQEASQRDVANTIELVKKHQIKAIFVESSINPALIKQVAKETGVKALGPLFSDSLGTKDSRASTYVDMLTENINIIVPGLGGKVVPFVVK